MSKTETRRLQREVWDLRISRRTKTPEYRRMMALVTMGSILECRVIQKAMEGGNEHAEKVSALMSLREHNLTSQLRNI